jgi:hypothetical protein
MKAEDIVVDDLNNEKLIRLKSIKSAPDSMRDISPEIRAKIAKGLASGVKIYLIELGVYDAKKGYNANRLSHQIARFLKVTNTSNFNPEQVAEGFGVDLNGEHENLFDPDMIEYKDIFEDIDNRFPRTELIRTIEDMLSKENNRFSLAEKKRMEDLFLMNGRDLPEDDTLI